MGMVEMVCFLAIGGGTAAAMAILASAFNSNHPNYICQFQYTTCAFDCGDDTWKVAQS
jgi:hypothetical protein